MSDGQESWNRYVIGNANALRKVLRSYKALAVLAAEGDVTSATIIADLDIALQYRRTDPVRVISQRQFDAINAYLIEGRPLNEVARTLRMDVRRVYYHVQQGLAHMLRYLEHKETPTCFMQPWHYEYLRMNAHLPRVVLAERLGKSETAVYKILWNLRKSGRLNARRAGGRPLGSGQKRTSELAGRRISATDERSVEVSA